MQPRDPHHSHHHHAKPAKAHSLRAEQAKPRAADPGPTTAALNAAEMMRISAGNKQDNTAAVAALDATLAAPMEIPKTVHRADGSVVRIGKSKGITFPTPNPFDMS